MNPEEYCRQRAASSGSSFYFSFLFVPPPRREAITALYAFCREVDDVVDECRDEGIARTKLQWWRDEIERAYRNAAQHPVARALYAPLERYNLPLEYFLEIIDGMEMDLDHSGYASFSELALYCHRVAGVVGLLAAEIFGYEDRRTLKFAQDLGTAFQLTNILRDVREDAARGRIYFPRDEMARFGIGAADVRQVQSSERMRAFLRSQAARAQQYYRQALAELPEADRYAQRSSLIMAEIYLKLLRRMEAQDFRVLEARTTLSPLHKLWIAWNTARREKLRHLNAGYADA